MNRFGCVRWLGLPILVFALLQLGAALTILRLPPEVHVVLPRWLLAGLALTWAALFAMVGGLWLGKQQYALQVSAWVVLAYVLVETLRFILFAQSDYERGRVGFRLLIAALFAIIPIAYLVFHYRGGTDGENNL